MVPAGTNIKNTLFFTNHNKSIKHPPACALPAHATAVSTTSMTPRIRRRPLFLPVILNIYWITAGYGSLLSAQQQVMRKWKLDLRYKDGCQLFGATDGIDMDEFVIDRTIWGGRRMICNLNVKMDGTFVIRPERVERRKESSSSSPDLSPTNPGMQESGSTEESSCQSSTHSGTREGDLNQTQAPQSLESLMMMNQQSEKNAQTQSITPQVGRWRVRSNPYCVTDRQYDDLCLVLYPKDTFTNKYKKLELRCRVWGRYGLSSVREALGVDARQCLRMTHGRIAGVQNVSKSKFKGYKLPWWQTKIFERDIVATFRAKPEIGR